MYTKGTLVKAITRIRKRQNLITKKIKNIADKLPINIAIKVRGKLYWRGLIPKKSQALASAHHRKKAPTGEGLFFDEEIN